MPKFTTKQLSGVNIPPIEDVVNYLNPSDAEGVRTKAVRDTEYRKGLETQFRERILTDNQRSPVSTISTDDGEDILDQTKKKFETQYGLEDETAGDVVEDKGEVVIEEEDVEKKEGGYTFEEAQEIWGNDFTGIKRDADGLFYPDTSAYERAGIKGMGEDLQEEVDETDQMIEDEYDKWQDYNVETDPAFISQTKSITSQYDILRKQMEKKNKSRQRAIETMGYRHGTRQYAGAIQLGIEGEELKQASQRLTDITSEELAAKSAARVAFENNEYTNFSQKVDALQTIRQNKADALSNYNDALIATNKAMTDQIKEEREAEKDERERQESVTENLANLVIASGTGDTETDMAFIKSLADEYGIDPNLLASEAMKIQTKMENDLMTTDIKEYRMAVSQGYEGTLKEWQTEQKGEELVSGGGGSKWRLDSKTGKYTMVVPPVYSPTTTSSGDPLFETETGETIDITTVAGIKRTIEIGKEKGEPVERADMKSYLDENTKLTIGSIDDLLDEAYGVDKPKEESVTKKVFTNLKKLKEFGVSRDEALQQILTANKLEETNQTIEDLLDNVYGQKKVGGVKKFFALGT